MARVAPDDLRGGGLIGAYHLAEIFGVETAREVVEPTRSQNSTVSCRRSASGALRTTAGVRTGTSSGGCATPSSAGGGLGSARGSQAAAATDEGGPRTAPGLGRAQGAGRRPPAGCLPVQTSPWPTSSRAS